MSSIIGCLQAFFLNIYAFFSRVFAAFPFLGRTRVNQDATTTDVEMGQVIVVDTVQSTSTSDEAPRLDINLPEINIQVIPQCSLGEAFRRYGQPQPQTLTPTSTPGSVTSKNSLTNSSLDHTTSATSGGEDFTASSSATSMSSHWRNLGLAKEIHGAHLVEDDTQSVSSEDLELTSPTTIAEGTTSSQEIPASTSQEQNQQVEEVKVKVAKPLPIDWVSIIQSINKFEEGISYGHSHRLFKRTITEINTINISSSPSLIITAFNIVEEGCDSDYDETEGFDEDYV